MNVLAIDCDRSDYLGITLVLAAIVVSTLCVVVLMHTGIVVVE
jgi:hypothetical protein